MLCAVVGLTVFLAIGGAAGLVAGVVGFATALEAVRRQALPEGFGEQTARHPPRQADARALPA
ncbi:hypothetical protein ACFQ08_37010, partial [Streptosporangium algeriense]